jgi:hypothetical protein
LCVALFESYKSILIYRQFVLGLECLDICPVLVFPVLQLLLGGFPQLLLVLQQLQHALVLGRQLAVFRLKAKKQRFVK